MRNMVIISGAKLRKFIACERLPFMDAHADPADAVEPPRPLLPDLSLYEEAGESARVTPSRGLDDEKEDGEDEEATKTSGVVAPPSGVDAALWTTEQMKVGAQKIARGLLRHEHWYGSPEWIEKKDGQSSFGPWLYEPGQSRWVRKYSTRSIAVPLTFYALLLEKLQGRRPRELAITSMWSGETESRRVAQYVEDTRRVIERLEEMLDRRRDPGPRLKTDCEKCRWQQACGRDATKQKHVTLLPNIRASAVTKLEAFGITDLRAFSRAPESLLQRVPGLSDAATVRRAIAQANAYCTGESVVVGDPNLPPRVSVEAFLDFEADPMTGEAFLTGLLVRRDRRSEYLPFLADSRLEIERVCRRFLKVVASLPASSRIYHYGPFERRVLRRFPAVRGVKMNALEARLVDVLPVVRRHAGIPSKSFGLKDVAAVLGMELPATGMEGRSAPAWWEAWVITGNDSYRRRLLTYNHADLQALVGIVDWLRGERPPATGSARGRPRRPVRTG